MRTVAGGLLLLLLLPNSGCDEPGPAGPSLLVPDSSFDFSAPDILAEAVGSPDQIVPMDGTGGDGVADAEVQSLQDGGEIIDLSSPDTLEVDAQSCLDDSGCQEGLYCHAESGYCVECTEFLHCKDDSPCTFDYCSEELQCAHNPLEGDCDDGNSCSTGDYCQDGICVYENLIECDDGNVCTEDSCTAGGDCLSQAIDGECDDGDPCSGADYCQDGICQPGPEPTDCDDGNSCTDDFCQPGVGCAHEPSTGQCDDGNLCTENDMCEDGACVGQAKQCADGNPCTSDSCDPQAGCVPDPLVGSPCDDENLCTVNDTCQPGGDCQGVDVDCDDGNPCTTEACSDGGAGCIFTLLDGMACDDGSACTDQDVCVAGQCVGIGKVCDDANSCTIDGCDPVSQVCKFDAEAANGLACNDQNACTAGDQCQNGQCFAGPTIIVCNDNNPCTEDSCSPEAGCVHDVQLGTQCDDGNACTSGDHCAGNGACEGQAVDCDDADQCTVDSCQPEAGCVNTVQVSLACNDGDKCTKNDKCKSSGKCKGTQKFCNDANECTSDSCNSATGCVHDPLPLTGAACDDLDSCTEDDTCLFGECGGDEIECADDDECTTDYCWQGDCVHQAIPGCGVSSCQAHCGQQVGQCFCDGQCHLWNDCCPDVCDFCNYNWCDCEPDCQGKECGNDGCGGSCGQCVGGEFCDSDGSCSECSCGEKECGQNQCGASCGSCPPGTFCLWMTGECLSW